MTIFGRVVLCAVLAMLAACQSMNSQFSGMKPTNPASPAVEVATVVPVSSRLPSTEVPALPPEGFIKFCARFEGQCTMLAHESDVITLTPHVWRLLHQVNNAVNSRVQAAADVDHYGAEEYWTLPLDYRGDCEDVALQKQKDLAAAGLPLRALRVAVAVAPSNTRHAVLTVVTDRGDYVLDSLRREILPWRHADYYWLQRQDPNRSWGWVAVRSPRPSFALTDAWKEQPLIAGR